jgi:hypothetical protein
VTLSSEAVDAAERTVDCVTAMQILWAIAGHEFAAEGIRALAESGELQTSSARKDVGDIRNELKVLLIGKEKCENWQKA